MSESALRPYPVNEFLWVLGHGSGLGADEGSTGQDDHLQVIILDELVAY